MKFIYLQLILLSFTLTLLSTEGGAQDIHFSQYYNSPQNLNPALTGVFAGDRRFTGNYRHQWNTVRVPYETFSGAYDSKLTHKILGKSAQIGWGVTLNNDRAGDGELGLTQVGLNLAYTRQMNDELFVTLGFQLATGQRSVEPAQLTFAGQWNGDQFDPSRPNGEQFAQTSRALSSVATGINLHYQTDQGRSKLDIGAGLFNLNRPETAFTNQMNVTLPRKVNAYGSGTLEVGEKTDLRFNALYSRQLSYQEVVFSPAVRYHLNLEKHKELALQVGVGYRLSDAVIPAIEIIFRNWRAGLSYDINTSPLKTASAQRGGPEIFFQYIIWKVHPPKEFKACPIF